MGAWQADSTTGGAGRWQGVASPAGETSAGGRASKWTLGDAGGGVKAELVPEELRPSTSATGGGTKPREASKT